jgi:hypothetical protein
MIGAAGPVESMHSTTTGIEEGTIVIVLCNDNFMGGISNKIKVFLRHCETGEYYAGHDKWVENRAEAHDFCDVDVADKLLASEFAGTTSGHVGCTQVGQVTAS